MSRMPTKIQIISLSLQMMLTNIPTAADMPNAAMEITNPPS